MLNTRKGFILFAPFRGERIDRAGRNEGESKKKNKWGFIAQNYLSMKNAMALQVETDSSFDTTQVLACLLLLWIIPCKSTRRFGKRTKQEEGQRGHWRGRGQACRLDCPHEQWTPMPPSRTLAYYMFPWQAGITVFPWPTCYPEPKNKARNTPWIRRLPPAGRIRRWPFGCCRRWPRPRSRR